MSVPAFHVRVLLVRKHHVQVDGGEQREDQRLDDGREGLEQQCAPPAQEISADIELDVEETRAHQNLWKKRGLLPSLS